MKNYKRFLAALSAASLVAVPTTAFAADTPATPPANGTSNGGSYIEGVAPTDILSVVLPTIADKTYDFILDPENLLAQYDSNKANYTSASLYFANANSKYTDTSEIATAVNKSSVPVLLSVDVTVTNVETNPVTFTKVADVESNTEKNVAISIVPTAKGNVTEGSTASAGTATKAQAIDIDANGSASATFFLGGSTDNFDITQVADTNATSGHKYTYTAKSDASWSTAGFALSGACNKKADWTDFNTASQDKTDGENLSVKVVYSMDALTDAQKEAMEAESGSVTADTTTGLIDFGDVVVTDTSISGSAYSRSATNNKYTITWATATEESDKTIKSILLSTDNVTYETAVPIESYSLSSDKNTLTIDGVKNTKLGSGAVGSTRYLKVTFGDNTTAIITLTNITA